MDQGEQHPVANCHRSEL